MLTKKHITLFLITLPVINIIFDILFVFDFLNSVFPYIRLLILSGAVVLFFMLFKSSLLKKNESIVLLIVYFAILIMFSERLVYSFSNLLKFSFPLVFYLIFINVINSADKLNLFLKSVVITGLLFNLNFVFARLFNLGRTVYGGDVDYLTGNFTTTALYTGSVFICLAPIILMHRKIVFRRYINVILILAAVVFIVMSLRRTAIFAIPIGLMTYFPLLKNKEKYLKILFGLVLVGLLIFPVFKDTIIDRFDTRIEKFDTEKLEEETRWTETKIIWSNVFSFNDVVYSFFGNQLFNSPGNYGLGSRSRPIHIDYNAILSGAGILGLILYLIVHIQIFTGILGYYRRITSKQVFVNMLFASSISLLIFSLFVSLSGGMLSVTYRIFLYSILGAFVGYLKSILNTNKSI